MIKKAVIPAAGFGTRLLPATKSAPKEMIPVVDTPVIQYVVEEAVASGITDILMIIGKGKRAIEEHFDRSYELEHRLEEKGKEELLKQMRHISDMANIHFIWQKEQNGLGDAIRYAENHVGNEPFAVLLGDTIMETDKTPVMGQLVKVFEQYGSSVVGLEEVEPARVSRYGILDGNQIEGDLYKANAFVEKPSAEEAPSNLAISGRYIFTPEIFDYLRNTTPGLNNEIQLTDAMRAMVQEHDFYGWVYHGKRHDVGNTLDFIKTNVWLGLQRPDVGPKLREWLKGLEL